MARFQENQGSKAAKKIGQEKIGENYNGRFSVNRGRHNKTEQHIGRPNSISLICCMQRVVQLQICCGFVVYFNKIIVIVIVNNKTK